MNNSPENPDEGLLPREDLRSLPLGFQTIWEKPLLSRDALRAITIENARWRSRSVAQASEKPISKIVATPEGPEDGPDSASR